MSSRTSVSPLAACLLVLLAACGLQTGSAQTTSYVYQETTTTSTTQYPDYSYTVFLGASIPIPFNKSEETEIGNAVVDLVKGILDYYLYLKNVTHVANVEGSTVAIVQIDTYTYYDHQLGAGIFNGFIRSTQNITISGSEYPIQKIRLYDDVDNALSQTGPKEVAWCNYARSFYPDDSNFCEEGFFCLLNTDGDPYCQRNCGNGTYLEGLEGDECVPCPEGKTTLWELPFSVDECYPICQEGEEEYDVVLEQCVPCEDGFYSNFSTDSLKICVACDDETSNAVCNSGKRPEMKNIGLNITTVLQGNICGDISENAAQFIRSIFRFMCHTPEECSNIEVEAGECEPDGSRYKINLKIRISDVPNIYYKARTVSMVSYYLAFVHKYKFLIPSLAKFAPRFILSSTSLTVTDAETTMTTSDVYQETTTNTSDVYQETTTNTSDVYQETTTNTSDPYQQTTRATTTTTSDPYQQTTRATTTTTSDPYQETTTTTSDPYQQTTRATTTTTSDPYQQTTRATTTTTSDPYQETTRATTTTTSDPYQQTTRATTTTTSDPYQETTSATTTTTSDPYQETTRAATTTTSDPYQQTTRATTTTTSDPYQQTTRATTTTTSDPYQQTTRVTTTTTSDPYQQTTMSTQAPNTTMTSSTEYPDYSYKVFLGASIPRPFNKSEEMVIGNAVVDSVKGMLDSNYVSYKNVTHVANVAGSTVAIVQIETYTYYSYMLEAGIFNSFIRSTQNITIAGSEYPIQKIRLYDDVNNALSQASPKEVNWCSYAYSSDGTQFCDEGFLCVLNTEGDPYCLKNCDDSTYLESLEGDECVPCPEGKTTLWVLPLSIDECYPKCQEGEEEYNFLLDQCVPCEDGFYSNVSTMGMKICEACDYETSNAVCNLGKRPEMKNIGLTITTVLQGNICGDISENAAQFIRSIFRPFCHTPEECSNIEVEAGECEPDGSRYKINLKIRISDVPNIFNKASTVSMVSYYLAFVHKFTYMSPSLAVIAPRFILSSTSVTVTGAEEDPRSLYVSIFLTIPFDESYRDVNNPNRQYFLEQMEKEAFSLFGTLQYAQDISIDPIDAGSEGTYIKFTFMFTFTTDVNYGTILEVAKKLSMARRGIGGFLGHPGWQLVGPIAFYKTKENLDNDIGELPDWCLVYKDLYESGFVAFDCGTCDIDAGGIPLCISETKDNEPRNLYVSMVLNIPFSESFTDPNNMDRIYFLEQMDGQAHSLFSNLERARELSIDFLDVEGEGRMLKFSFLFVFENKVTNNIIVDVAQKLTMARKSLQGSIGSSDWQVVGPISFYKTKEDFDSDKKIQVDWCTVLDGLPTVNAVPISCDYCIIDEGGIPLCSLDNPFDRYFALVIKKQLSQKQIALIGSLAENLVRSRVILPSIAELNLGTVQYQTTKVGSTTVIVLKVTPDIDVPLTLLARFLYHGLILDKMSLEVEGIVYKIDRILIYEDKASMDENSPLDIDWCLFCGEGRVCFRPDETSDPVCLDARTAQKELYPYGPEAGDKKITYEDVLGYESWNAISDPLKIPSGVPLGTNIFKDISILPWGVMTFGRKKRAYWPDLEYANDMGYNLIAPFWTYIDPSLGSVYYHLYDSNNDDNGWTSPHMEYILKRATEDVKEFNDKDSSFSAKVVVVATFQDMERYDWYSWVCKYAKREEYQNYEWLQELYAKYCLDLTRQTVTYQAVYMTDGAKAYAQVVFKANAMKWRNDRYSYYYTPIIGSVSDTGVKKMDVGNFTQLDKIVGNSGRIGTFITQVGEKENPQGKCMSFYQSNKHLIKDPEHQEMIAGLFDCPCSLSLVGAQWWFNSWRKALDDDRTVITCLAISPTAKRRLERLQGNTLNKLCCYKYRQPNPADYVQDDGSVDYWSMWNDWWEAFISAQNIETGPDAGHLLTSDPWYWWGSARESRINDLDPHKWCCRDIQKGTFCDKFKEVRPSEKCNPDPVIISGRALGDPHIVMLDGNSYTMNGLGEYVLVSIASEQFYIQARTAQPTNADGKLVNATVFTALAVKEGDTTQFQVELDEQSMLIIVNGENIKGSFYSTDDYTQTFEGVDVVKKIRDSDEKVSVVASFSSGNSISAYVGKGNLEFSIDLHTQFKNTDVLGLMGNFDGNSDNDFVLPNGQVLPATDVDTEKKILENFAEAWRVTDANTVFVYEDGKDTSFYQNKNFVPIFLDTVATEVRQAAEAKCGTDYACLFDFVATGDESFAQASKDSNKEATSVKANQDNKRPTITLQGLNDNGHLELSEDQTVTLSFEATDPEGETVSYEMLDDSISGVTFDSAAGTVSFRVSLANPVAVGVRARDNSGGFSPDLQVTMVIRPNCSGRGEVDVDEFAREELNGQFRVYACNCLPAYTGDNCEEEVDGCESNPCQEGQVCTSISAAEDQTSEKRYNCGECPEGYRTLGGTCIDEDECSTGDVCPENSNCINKPGSFECSCATGFRPDPNSNTLACINIDECAEGTHDCEQDCDDTQGGFICSCLPGNTLNADMKTCQQDTIVQDKCNEKGCSEVCSIDASDEAVCSCKKGHQLNGETECVDFNECEAETKFCSQLCQNSEPGFSCFCYPGYELEADGTTCTKCEYPNYGVECSETCMCNGEGTCDHRRGCICNSGWTGEHCDEDVNECSLIGDEAVCQSGELCVNTLGSFRCDCPQNFTRDGSLCVDVNECEDIMLHNCDLSREKCVNTIGNFDCACRPGFARNPGNGKCEDIDECKAKTDNCEYICENSIGSFNCKCPIGFRMQEDLASCLLSEDPCEGQTELSCAHICQLEPTTGTPQCSCKPGYRLVGTEACEDIDECDLSVPHLNLCEYKESCENIEGNYKCSCPTGKMLDLDKRSCIDCPRGKWGNNCSNNCECTEGRFEQCLPQKGCICKTGFMGAHCEQDINECVTGMVKCGEGEICVNTPGSAHCECQKGYSLQGGTCADINECGDPSMNTCDQDCVNIAGGYTCECFSGFKWNDVSKACEDIDECTLKLQQCESGCENTIGGYRCKCDTGMKLNSDGVSCRPESACELDNNPCEEQDKCRLVDSQPVCSCSRGKEVDSNDITKCIDKDFCLDDPCLGTCTETDDGTSYVCSCPAGQKVAQDGYSCDDCVEGTYGENCASTCQCRALNTVFCDKRAGTCICKEGYEGMMCENNIDECTTSSPCPEFSSCTDTPGSFICTCDDGYYKDGAECKVCQEGWYGAGCSKQCDCDSDNTMSCDTVSGQCNCKQGWTGASCDTDIKECDAADNPCVQAGIANYGCLEELGGYQCACLVGYVNQSNQCIDLDECATSSTNQCDQNCINTIGSYTCSCNPGYIQTDSFHCEDEDECKRSGNSAVCQQGCTNFKGSYRCFCNQDSYEIDNEEVSKCYIPLKVDVSIKLEKEVEDEVFTNPSGDQATALKEKLMQVFLAHFKKFLTKMKKFEFKAMRKGSVVIDGTVFADKAQDTMTNSQIVEALIAMAETGVVVDGQSVPATVTLGSINVTADSDKCEILALVDPCTGSATCTINDNGEAYCKGEDPGEDIGLIVGLAVGIPLAVGLIVAIVFFIKYKHSQKARLHGRIGDSEQVYDSSSRPSTGRASRGSAFFDDYLPNIRGSKPDVRPPSSESRRMAWDADNTAFPTNNNQVYR